LNDVYQTLETTKDELSDWRQEFLKKALSVGRTIFKPHLDEAADLWARCVARRGGGSGYRDDIADMVQNWFETNPELNKVRRKLEGALNAEWSEVVLERLITATQFDDIDDD
jgi:hypothetical protein